VAAGLKGCSVGVAPGASCDAGGQSDDAGVG
jgi:hypothetical protein